MPFKFALTVFFCFLAITVSGWTETVRRVRIGHFANVTHAQALVAHHLSRQGKGWFEARLGPGVVVEWFVYNAGPSAMEGILARSIDLTYVGPSPAINAYARSNGKDIRIVAGAVDGGAGCVVQPDSGIRNGSDFRGKRIATPQLGNTQDVACRAYLKAHGLHITQVGGDAYVIPTPNPDQVALFKSKRVDAVWTVEPWLTRLIREAGGVLFLEEKDAVTTVLVSSERFATREPELLAKIAQANAELTDWINAHPAEAQRIVVAELEAITRSRISPAIIADAWGRMIFTSRVSREGIEQFVRDARAVGFLRRMPPLDHLFYVP